MIAHESSESPAGAWGSSRLLVDTSGDHWQTTVQVWGEIDICTADEFADIMRDALGRNALRLIVDLSGITFFGVAGLRILLRLRQEAEALATDLYLRSPSYCVRNVIEITGVSPQFRWAVGGQKRTMDVPVHGAGCQ